MRQLHLHLVARCTICSSLFIDTKKMLKNVCVVVHLVRGRERIAHVEGVRVFWFDIVCV